MQYLIDIAEDDLDIRELSKRVENYPSVQGLVLDLDPFWLASWALTQYHGRIVAERLLYPYLHSFLPHAGPLVRLGPPNAVLSLLPRFVIYPRPIHANDLTFFKPPLWQEYQKSCNFPSNSEMSPVIIRVFLRPPNANEQTPPIESLQTSRYRVVLEVRRQATLSSNPRRKVSPIVGGVSVGKTGCREYGTLSIVVADDTGKRYGITCSHVADQHGVGVVQPSLQDSRRAVVFGRRIDGNSLQPCQENSHCNPWASITNINLEDIALIEIDNAKSTVQSEVLDVGRLNGVVSRSLMSTGQSVDVMGRTSKHNVLNLGGVAAWFRLSHRGSFYCFKHLFQVQSPYGIAGTIKSGDSGAPVCTPSGPGTGWCGMIVGDDGVSGFAMYSETIRDWWRAHGYSLTL